MRRWGTGSITWRERDARWQASYSAGGRRRYLYARTHAEAERLLTEALGSMPEIPVAPDGRPISPRRTLTPRRRFEVLERDGFRCRYCGASPSDGIRLVVDHIVPVADGGTDDWDNLAAACHECNAGKGRHPLIRPKTETQ